MMTIGWPLAGTVATAMATSWLVTRLVRARAASLGLVDVPNERSSHRRPVPRGGGAGVVLGTWAGLLVAGAFSGGYQVQIWTVLAALAAVAVTGLVDDVVSLNPGIRLAVQLAAAAFVVRGTGPLKSLPLPEPLNAEVAIAVGWGLAVLFIVAVTNFFNFMDGIDGLASGQAVASFGGVVLAGWSGDAALLAVCAGAAALAFLGQNWSPARIFLGDVGSESLGFLIACLPFLAPPGRRGAAVLAVVAGLSLFLLDPVITLIRRARAGKKLTQAHREHVYQALVGPGEPAARAAGGLIGAGALLATLGASSYERPELAWVAVGAGLAAFAIEWSMARKASRVYVVDGSALQA